jgi:hypothetical protein
MKNAIQLLVFLAPVFLTVDSLAQQGATLWYPEGTRITQSKNTPTLVAPDGWSYLGRTADGSIQQIGTGNPIKVSCDCTSSGNCNPAYLDGKVFCKTTNCSACSMTTSGMVNGKNVDFVEGVYQKLSEPVRLTQVNEDLPEAKGLMFESEETLAKLVDFLQTTYGSAVLPELKKNSDGSWTPPANYAIVGINWCGRGVIFAVPKLASLPGGGGKDASCSCTDGSCTLKSQWVPGHGTGYSCEGNCSGTCTLTVTGFSTGSVLYKFTSFKF